MSISAFMEDGVNNDYINQNKFGFRLPPTVDNYIALADEIETVSIELLTSKGLTSKKYLQVIELAFRVFGPRMGVFVSHTPKQVGPMTYRFINETKALVFKGTPRDIDIRTWDGMLDGPTLALSVVSSGVSEDTYTQRDISMLPQLQQRRELSFTTVQGKGGEYEYLVNWISRDRGIKDMLCTLQHCYGKQSLARQLDVTQV